LDTTPSANNSWAEWERLPYKLGCIYIESLKAKVYVCGGMTLARVVKAIIWPGNMGARYIMEYIPR
jgi:hypothetical protein